jgi:hypothetical protein
MPLADEDKNRIAVEALLSETSRLGDAIAERHAAAERFVAVAGAFAGVGLTLGLSQSQRVVLTILPLAVIVILIYMIQIYTDAGMHSGHRQALEIRLQSEFGYPVVVGQSHVAAGYARRRSVALTLPLVGIIWLATAIAGGFAVFHLWHSGWIRVLALILYVSVLVLAVVVAGMAAQENRHAEDAAKKTALDAWPAPPAPPPPASPGGP